MPPLDRTPVGTELLDDLSADPASIERSLRHIARANRWFGGLAAVRFGFRRVIGRRAGPITVLDIGAGFGDVAADLVGSSGRAGVVVRPIGIERHPAAARVGFSRGLPVVLADGLVLPLPDRAVDVVVVSQVIHHLTPRRIIALAREATRVARIGVVFADLRRSKIAALLFRLASWALGFDRNTRIDGVTSVHRGFRRVELEEILRDAGLDAAVTDRPFARIVATWNTAA